MNDARTIAELQKTIETLTRFIESESTPQNSREKAIKTRE